MMRRPAVFFSAAHPGVVHPFAPSRGLRSLARDVVEVESVMSWRSLSATCVLALSAVMGGCKEEQGIKVTSFKFTGVNAITDGQLRSVLATAPSAKLPWGEKHYFSRDQFQADLKRIEAFYRDRGFPDARVTAFDTKLNSDQTSVAVTVTVSEGQPVLVERIVFQGFEALPEEHRQALETTLPLKQGQPLDRALLQASRESALDELKDHGFPYATVQLADDPGSSDRHRVVTLTAEPGMLSYFGPVKIQGNSSVDNRIIRRQLTYRPGQIYQQSKLLESQRRLYTLEVFQFASVKTATTEPVPEIPTSVVVTEGKHRKVNLDLGYGSEEKARAELDWRHVNFFGGARTVGVLGRYSGLDRGVRLSVTEPYIFSRNYSLTLSGQFWHNDEPAFTLDTQGGQLTLTRRFGRASRPGLTAAAAASLPTTLSFGYVNEREDSTISEETLNDPTQRDDLIALGLNPDTRSAGGRRSALLIDAGRNTTDNLIDSHRGYVATAHLEQAGGWLGGDFDYTETVLEGRYYQSLGTRAVVAVKARAGSVAALGTSDQATVVPFFKRYFLGGATTLRGWGRYDVSPLDSTNEPIGGQTVFNFSTEIRVPITGKFSGVLFLDGGNVWADPWTFKVADMRYDVGPGLRYVTPIGPLRFDFGYQLNPIPDLVLDGEPEKRHFRLHFSIGQAF